MKLTEHFDSWEFACHDGDGVVLAPYPSEWLLSRLRPLCVQLEAVRAVWGKPVVVVSGYRTHARNVAVGGALMSVHLEGRAADVRIDGIEPVALMAQVENLRRCGKVSFGGLGLYEGWVHLDIRDLKPNGEPARWCGVGVERGAWLSDVSRFGQAC